MQKKIIALAVAGLVSGAAYAQVAPNNVTLYGIVDMGYAYSWDNSTDNTKSKSEMKSGGLDGSRVGVKGEEDLGNGLKAGFDATWAFGSDTNSSVTMGEGSSVYLTGNFGKVRAGYFGNFLDDNSGVDASGRHGQIHTGSLYDTGKYENFLAYYSPVFSGFQVKAGWSSNVGEQDKTVLEGATDLNTRAYTAAVAYENGPIKAGIAYAKYIAQESTGYVGNTSDGSDWNAGIKYDFGVAAVSLFGGQQKNGEGTGALPNFGDVMTQLNADKKNFWALGFNAPIGANDTIKVGYGQSKVKFSDGTDDLKGKAWDIVYLHSLSKRSTVYAMYGNLAGSDDGYFANADGATNTYKQFFNVGLRHTF
jgi:predicted porin